MPVRVRAGAAATALSAVALLLGCGSEPEPAAAPAPEAAPGPGPSLDAAQARIEALPDPLRQELLRTCDKWRHLDHPCDEERVRRDVLECWVEKGERIYTWAEGRGTLPRALYLRTLTEMNLCMELARWRKISPVPELTTREG